MGVYVLTLVSIVVKHTIEVSLRGQRDLCVGHRPTKAGVLDTEDG